MLGAIVDLKKDARWRMIQSYLRRIECAHLDKIVALPSSKIATPYTAYPSFLTKIVDLRKVILSDHKLPDLPFGVLGCFSSVTHLDLSNNCIQTVHPEIGNLTLLRTLDLSGNPVSVLPLEIGYITSMTSFRIDVERLMVPPKEISELGVDVVLDWLKWVAAMRRTREGDLTGRGLTHLPVEVSWVTVLTTLDLSSNNLSALHPECSTLVHLRCVLVVLICYPMHGFVCQRRGRGL
jgi:Leucine-rich repeat (LRR) protein